MSFLLCSVPFHVAGERCLSGQVCQKKLSWSIQQAQGKTVFEIYSDRFLQLIKFPSPTAVK